MFFYEYDGERLENGFWLTDISGTAGIPWHPQPIVVRQSDFPKVRPGDVINEGFIVFSNDTRYTNSLVTDRNRPPFTTLIVWLHSGNLFQVERSLKFIGERKYEHYIDSDGLLCGIERFEQDEVSEVLLKRREDGKKFKRWLACYRDTSGDLNLVHLEDFDKLKLHLRQFWLPSRDKATVTSVLQQVEGYRDKRLANFLRSEIKNWR